MICAECGFENADGVRFCGGCGVEFASADVRDEAAEDGVSEVEGLSHGSEGEVDPAHIGPYEIRGELGRGAMARVWRAWDPNLGREVAVKEPLFDSRLGEDVLDEMGRRFVKEAKTAARLNHPGIVTIYAADVYDGRPAIVMELVEGATLGDILEGGPLSPTSALDVLDQLLDAVGYAHEEGVIHRDIKPDNVFVNERGQVKLADFGIAHVDDASVTRATIAGAVLGTPGYMAPEQATGRSVDARSDLFSIGAVAYEMLTGRNPFGAGDGADATTLIYRIVPEPAPDLPDWASAGLPVDVRPVIMAALSKGPDERPRSAAEFKAMLHGGSVAQSIGASGTAGGFPSKGVADKRGKGAAPKWLPYALVAVVGVVVLAVVLANALSGSGGSGGSAGSDAAAQSSSASAAPTSSPVYLAVKDGKVAIFTNSSATPYETSEVEVADLSDDVREALDEHVGFSTVEEARAKVEEYAEEAEKAAREAEAEARMEAGAETSARAQEPSDSAMYVVNCNEFITLRDAPSADAAELDRIPLGASVTYLGPAGDGFYRISYRGQTGYGLASYLATERPAGSQASVLMRVVNCNEWISLREAPSTSADAITTIPLGDSVRFISVASNGFYQVSYDGRIGYALSQYLAGW